MLDANDSGGNDIELALIGANGPKQVNLAERPAHRSSRHEDR